MSRQVIIDITVSPEEFLKLYQGSAKDATVRARDGRIIRFPARILQPFLLHDGIHGSFVISFDNHNKFERIDRLHR